jgi:hypothetical protein
MKPFNLEEAQKMSRRDMMSEVCKGLAEVCDNMAENDLGTNVMKFREYATEFRAFATLWERKSKAQRDEAIQKAIEDDKKSETEL